MDMVEEWKLAKRVLQQQPDKPKRLEDLIAAALMDHFHWQRVAILDRNGCFLYGERKI